MIGTQHQSSQTLKLWEKIEIVVGEDSEQGYYISRIEEIIRNGVIVSAPEFVRGKSLLRDNIDVVAMVTKEDAVYQFPCRIKKLKADSFRLTSSGKIRRVQRRRFVRIDYRCKVMYSRLPSRGSNESGFLKWNTSYSVNISGGGILIKLQEKIPVDDVVLLRIDLFNELNLPDIIAGISRRHYRENDNHLCGIEFVDGATLNRLFTRDQLVSFPRSIRQFDLRTQNILANHIFKKQIELRQKGIL